MFGHSTALLTKRIGQAFMLSFMLFTFSGCSKTSEEGEASSKDDYVPSVFTSDIKEGIETHISEQVKLGNVI